MGFGARLDARLLCGAALLALTAFGSAAHAADNAYYIPAQPLDRALRAFGDQSGVTILADTDLTAGKRTRGYAASASPETALKALLNGTGLKYKRDGNVFVVTKISAEGRPASPQFAAAAPPAQGQATGAAAVDELIVTAQKKEERIQSVPIAISAFTGKALDQQKIEGGPDLLKAIPNVTFSKNNFSSYNLQIRGVGTKAVSVTTDPAVAISFNNTPMIRNRLFEQEYFDIERVEVLRGPQGTLYGRNATGGVVNVITAKPTDNFEGQLKAEVGNYDTRRLSGFVNVPLGDTFAMRIAGASTQRNGFDHNTITGNDVNGRDLWSGRVSLQWKPVDRFRANFVWEHFNENDNRSRTGKQLCTRDPGPSSIAGFGQINAAAFPFSADPNATTNQIRGILSQGCLPGSLFNTASYGTPNGNSLPLVIAAQSVAVLGFDALGNQVPLLRPGVDPYGNQMQSPDLRTIASKFDPRFRAKNDVYQLNLDFDLTNSLKLFSQTLYTQDRYYSSQDYNRFNTQPVFNNSSGLYDLFGTPLTNPGITPGGIYTDPQLGPSSTIVGMDVNQARSKQWSQEFRLQSSFDGPVNFSVGANYLRYETKEDYYVMFNIASAIAQSFLNGGADPGVPCPTTPTESCVYVDPNPINKINGQGHNYFRSANPYVVNSTAVFGEVYWQLANDVKITAGLRYTDDHKRFTPTPSQLLLAPGPVAGGYVSSGYPTLPDIKQSWGEFTGRLGVDWKPQLSFTDQTLVYAFYSRGYKGGGANPPGIGSNPQVLNFAPQPTTFRPEFINAFEVGTKNTLMHGALTLNASAFYYDYTDYQVSKIVDRTAANENFDATMWGVELESVWRPTRNLQINANLGYLNTELASGSKSIDLMNRTQGNPDWTLVRPWLQLASNCIAPTSLVSKILTFGDTAPVLLTALCGGSYLGNYKDPTSVPSLITGIHYDPATQAPNGGAGFYADVGGNELPNSPHWTFNIGAQYTWDLPAGWNAVLRGDFYQQSSSYARVYNTSYDRLKSWNNANLSLTVARPQAGLVFQVYAKNLFDKTPITDSFTNSDDTGLTTNVFTLDPRLIGVSVSKTF